MFLIKKSLRGSQLTFMTQIEKVIFFRYTFWSLTGVPTDIQDTAWHSDHFSLHFSPLTGGPNWPPGHSLIASKSTFWTRLEKTAKVKGESCTNQCWPVGWCLRRRAKMGSWKRSGQAATRDQEPRRQPGHRDENQVVAISRWQTFAEAGVVDGTGGRTERKW